MTGSTPPAGTERWRNRIIERVMMRVGDLLDHEGNPWSHPKRQQEQVQGLLDSVGKLDSIKAWRSERANGKLCSWDGHLRKSLDPDEIWPVDITDLTDEEADLVIAVYNRTGFHAELEAELLEELLSNIQTGNAAVQQMLDEMAEQAGLDVLVAVGGGGDEFDTTPDEGPTRTQLGDLWQLGEHRLLVGDCTVAANVARLMEGAKAEMVWADPPYGVSIGDKNKLLNSIGRSNRIEENLTNDTLDEAGILAMLRGAFAAATSVCLAGGAWYVAAPAGPLHLLWGQALNELGIWRQTIQWVKNNATFSPMGVDYHWRAEPIFYGWAPGAAHRYHGGRKQDTVWEINRPAASPDHPTMKPIELVSRAVANSSKTAELVLDPFLGSGTTIIACERLGRKCYGLEIEPGYADVTLRRWEAETGKVAVLLERLSTPEQPPTAETDGSVDASL